MNWKGFMAVVLLCGVAGKAGAVGKLADVTVVDRANGRVLPVYRHEGRHYVVGRPGAEYRIRVHNRTGADILAVVSVDGVNAVSGETADWKQTGYVLGPYQSFDIRGWRKSLRRVAAFFFTEHRNSYAARTGRPDNVGVLGVAVFRRKTQPEARIEQRVPRRELPAGDAPEGNPDPAAADAASGGGAHGARSAEGASEPRQAPLPEATQRSSRLGTGHGRSETSRVTYTAFERASLDPEEVVTIHYNTHRNLAAMGVIPAPRIATPFPGQFVPDPR